MFKKNKIWWVVAFTVSVLIIAAAWIPLANAQKLPIPARCKLVDPKSRGVVISGIGLPGSVAPNKIADTSDGKPSCLLSYFYESVFWTLGSGALRWEYIPQHRGDLRYRTIDPVYMADFTNDEILVGVSHNIFLAKVLREIGTKDLGMGPETQYEVEVVENIKGDINGTVTVDQMGGYKDGVLYIVEGGESMSGDHRKPEDYMLKPGSTYLLATRYNEKENWYTLNSYHTASKLLSSDASADVSALKSQSESDARVQELRAAYPNEVLIDADVAHGKTFNSYNSLSENSQE